MSDTFVNATKKIEPSPLSDSALISAMEKPAPIIQPTQNPNSNLVQQGSSSERTTPYREYERELGNSTLNEARFGLGLYGKVLFAMQNKKI